MAGFKRSLDWRAVLKPGKSAILSAMRRLPISSKIAGPPKRIENSSRQWVEKTKYEAAYQEVIPATEVVRAPPRKVETRLHWKFERLLKERHEPAFVVTVKDGRLWGFDGEIITPDDSLLSDICRGSHSRRRLRLGSLRRVDMRVGVLTAGFHNCYFHWMVDILCRFELLRLARLKDLVDAFVVPPGPLPFQRQSYEKLGLRGDQLIFADDPGFHLEAAQLFAPSLPPLDSPPRWVCLYLRELFLDSNNDSPPGPGRRIYIDRRQASGRQVVNESEVYRELSKRGFERVQLERMSVSDQARFFQDAECVVAPHGAGLTNIVFCRPGTVVIDLFAPAWVNPCFWVMAEALDLRYSYLIGEGERPPEGCDPEGKGDDILVSLPLLRALLTEEGILG